MIFGTIQLARLAPPIAYNFILIEKYVESSQGFVTAYENTYGTIEEVPIFGLTAAKALPIFILLFMLLNISNFYARIMNFFGLGIFTFGTGIYDERKFSEGK